ncbi:MAG: DMT family transporter [Bryobacteraceae bacterium]
MRPASPRLRAELALASVAFIWGSTFVIVKSALEDVSTFLFLAIRFSLASLLLAFWLRARLFRRTPVSWRGGALCGVLLFLGYALQTAGLRWTTASNSAFITGLYVVLVPLLASLVYRSRPRWLELAGAALAAAGTALLSGGMPADWNRGDLLTAACAVAFAAHILAVERYSRRMDFERLSLLQIASVAALSWIAAAWLEPARVSWTPRLLWALAATSVLATALSFVLYTWAQGLTSAARAALIFALEPVFAGIVAWAAAGERWTAASLAGAAMILAAIVLVELKPAAAAGHRDSGA